MGDMADMMMDGTLCECCGGIVDDDEMTEAPGYPQTCDDCS
ncbi:hypothetical protein [Salibacterium lacus]|uniref:Small CPxCG-related zinc finger protein n=1 Tax=Salibacterium lacus TaxID=1898109 RepID=A0ABW5T0G3_9BACI